MTSSPLFHLFYPHTCIGCGSDVINDENFLCLQCINELPHTNFAIHKNNPVEKLFWGRIALSSAMSEFYFSKGSIVQNMIHEFKYRGNKKAGHYFGKLMGKSLLESDRFNVNIIVPLPLFEKKEKLRGFNQAEILCNGISEIINKPVIRKNVIRKIFTETQTKKHRLERWKNVEGIFFVKDPEELEGKHILLVDDVITTGATIDACGSEILKIKNATLSVASFAIA
ncbi:MAG: ComF family protein [Bacteroidota bacterium]|nr:ComF family protein [Bacteroidota bacterium]